MELDSIIEREEIQRREKREERREKREEKVPKNYWRTYAPCRKLPFILDGSVQTS